MKLGCLKHHPEGTVLNVRVQPRSSKSQLIGLQGELLKIKLMAPPVEGAANKACCEYLADFFGLAKGKVVLLTGKKSRQKTILLRGLDQLSAVNIINSYLRQS